MGKERRYGQQTGNLNGRSEDKSHCIKEIFDSWYSHQCSRKRGHGPDGLYCKQHDPERIAQKYKEEEEIRNQKYAKEEGQHLRRRKALELIEGIPTKELGDYVLVRCKWK